MLSLSLTIRYALPAVVVVAGFAASAEAARKVQRGPQDSPQRPSPGVYALPEPSEEVIPAGQPLPFNAAHISYVHHGALRKACYGCKSVTVNLCIQDPCTGVVYDVPVCLPDCCTHPKVVVEKGVPSGKAISVYVWNCGAKVKIIRDRCGDITVHMIGC